MNTLRVIFVFVLVAVLAACTPAAVPQNGAAPTQTTGAASGATATAIPDEADTQLDPIPTQAETAPVPTLPVSEERIIISSPGQNAAVSSPFTLEGLAQSPFEAQLGARLTDFNGVILAEAYPRVQAQMGVVGPYSEEISFMLEERDTIARLSVYSTSPRDGGLVHLSSVIVRLNPSEEVEVSPQVSTQEQIEILSPAPGDTVSGGKIIVTGNSAYFFEANLSMMLCKDGGFGGPHLICGNAGSVLAEGFAMIDSPDMGIGGVFAGEISYSVDAETNARLVVFAVSPMDGSIEHLSSVEITLLP